MAIVTMYQLERGLLFSGSLLLSMAFKKALYYVTLLYESGVDPLVAMKMVGHRDYQTTANIYTHLKEDSASLLTGRQRFVLRCIFWPLPAPHPRRSPPESRFPPSSPPELTG